jgi:hypothetical protein
MLTKAPPRALTMPGSVPMAATIDAIAASTAFPPAWAAARPAWTATGPVAATATCLLTLRLCRAAGRTASRSEDYRVVRRTVNSAVGVDSGSAAGSDDGRPERGEGRGRCSC